MDKMPRSVKRPPQKTGEGARHPNGGGDRAMSPPMGRMPKKVKAAPIKHGGLDIPSAKMPRNMSGGQQLIPRRK